MPKLAGLPFSDAAVETGTDNHLAASQVDSRRLARFRVSAGMTFMAGEPMKRATNRFCGRS